MNCNIEAFEWVMDVAKVSSNHDAIVNGEEKSTESEIEEAINMRMSLLDDQNCLNILVTSHFLHIMWLYEKIWYSYFKHNFAAIINACKIALSNLNVHITKDVALRISDVELEKVQERKDKFVSNVYKIRIEQKLLGGK